MRKPIKDRYGCHHDPAECEAALPFNCLCDILNTMPHLAFYETKEIPMLSLKTCTVGEDGVVTATYLASYKPGKDAEAVRGTVTLAAHAEGAHATLALESASADSEEAAFDALAATLEAMAQAIRARGEPKLGVPFYG